MKIGSKKQKKEEKVEAVEEVKPVEPEVEEETQEETEEEERDLLDILLDKDNKENVVLYNGEGKRIEFEQIAIIPIDREGEERKLYVILKPVELLEGMSEDEAVVFLCDFDEEGETRLTVEENDDVAKEVFEKYYELIRKEQ